MYYMHYKLFGMIMMYIDIYMHIIFKFQIITHSYTGTCIIKPGKVPGIALPGINNNKKK